jgi:FkbM family methyltransferase
MLGLDKSDRSSGRQRPKVGRSLRASTGACWLEIEAMRDRTACTIGGSERLQQGVAIFGSGYLGGLLRARLATAAIPVKYFVDNDTTKQGSTAHEVKIVAPTAIRADPPALVIIAAHNATAQIKAQLSRYDIPVVSFDAFCVVDDFDRFAQVHDQLADDRSRLVFESILKGMLTDDDRCFIDVFEPNQYFALPRFAAPAQDHVVDAGAFVGDTIERLLWASSGNVTKIYAFEPGPAQMAALRKRLIRLSDEWALAPEQVECVQAGLAADCGEMPFNANPGILSAASFKIAHGRGTVPVYALDNFMAGRPITFIKADIEGMELELLAGARRTIETMCPRLALSAYHEPAHLHAIPLYLKTLVPKYKIAIRHHAPSRFETVLYCWIE